MTTHQNIRRLDVSVRDVVLVKMLDRLAQQKHDTPDLRLVRTRLRGRECAEVAVHQRHHEEVTRGVIDRNENGVHRKEAEKSALTVGAGQDLTDVVARDARFGSKSSGHDAVRKMLLLLFLLLLIETSSS